MILKSAKIKGPYYNEEEKAFLNYKLDELISEYTKHIRAKILKRFIGPNG